MIIEQMTMDQVSQGLTKSHTVLIPAGSIEEHGTHLPLSTDQLTIYEICRKVAETVPVFVTPPLFYGVCRSTSRHPGTITISTATLKLLIRDIASSLYAQGFRKFILVSGHAGSTHMSALTEAGEWVLENLTETTVAVLSIIDLITQEFMELVETPGDSHAGEVETSLVMHLRPEWVHGSAPREFPDFPHPILVRNKRDRWPGGVWGDPTKASPEKGERLFSLLVKELLHLIERVQDFRE